MFIDATNLILGRFATIAAKTALKGEEVIIINCEKAMVTGQKKQVLGQYQQKVNRGVPLQGPYFPRRSDMIVRRTIRGMLPFKTNRGREAYKKVRCFLGVPEAYKNQKPLPIPGASVSKVPNLHYVRLEHISRILGAKQ